MRKETREAQELKNGVVALTAQALAHGARIHIMGILTQTEQSVDTLANKTGQSRANTSAHLKVLAAAGLVASRRAGRNTIYRLASPQVAALFCTLHTTAVAQSAELRELLQTYYEQPEQLTRKRAKEIVAQVRSGEVILLDVRPEDEFANEHPKGAINIPLPELQRRIDELPKDQEIIVYCRGRLCVLAVEGTTLLREAGRAVQNLGAAGQELVSAGLRPERS